jgi:hypothetical protein
VLLSANSKQSILVTVPLGDSEYAFQQIRERCPPEPRGKIVRSSDGELATVYGAVVAGVQQYSPAHVS